MWQDFEAACWALPTKQFALNRTSKVDSNTDFSKKINFVIYLIKNFRNWAEQKSD